MQGSLKAGLPRAYHFVVWCLGWILWPWLRLRVEGRENLPEGGALVASNHVSRLDIPVLARALVPRGGSFVARSTLTESPSMGFLMRHTGVILIHRGQSDRAALRSMAAHLEREELVVIFPEGTRSPDGRLQPFKGGALLAARMAGRPIVPCAILGSFESWPRGRLIPRPGRVTVRFGRPVDPKDPRALELVQRAVADLLLDREGSPA
ncbi:MAG: 1-acyl-sn-glycerol-3-phosphate acyltransferase [Planctomycetota bacterium]|jgi:1-acyl-sn-glycerol-3-phosphate acyltransferase